jgi:hypothetical protein
MAPDAGNAEIILLLSAREYNRRAGRKDTTAEFLRQNAAWK